MKDESLKNNSDFYIQKVKDILDSELGQDRFVHVMTFGCQQNEADSERLLGIAMAMGYKKCDNKEDASLILVNTCAIREHAELKALSVVGSLKHIKAKRPELIIGVCGCMTAQEHRVAELKTKYPYVSFTIDPSEISILAKTVYDVLVEKKRKFLLMESEDNIGEGLPVYRENKNKAWLSVMYGCNNFCTYCIVPYVRDRERSRDKNEILKEARELVLGGAREITLLGQNVNSYKGECDFATLIDEVAGFEGDYLVRFMTSHPKDASDRLFDVMKNNPKIAKHFHLPLQSGSDKILSLMNRKYDTQKYLSIVEKLRQRMPDITLTSDIIVGFPGETEEDFQATLDIMKKVKFDMVFSFIYSRRKGTPAYSMEGQVPREVQNERFSRLLKLQDEISYEKNLELVGKTMRVYCEGKSKNDTDRYSARTEGNKLVHFEDDTGESVGKFVYVKIDRADPYALHATLIK